MITTTISSAPAKPSGWRAAAIGLMSVGAIAVPTSLYARQSASTAGVVVNERARTATTTSGAPIRMPSGPLETVVSTYRIAPGAMLPVHRHPYPRYGYVMAGTLCVMNVESGQAHEFRPGDLIAEDVGVWHRARNVGRATVTLLVIDFVPPGQTNVVRAGDGPAAQGAQPAGGPPSPAQVCGGS